MSKIPHVWEAPRRARPKLTKRQRAALDAVKCAGEGGLTAGQVAGRLNLPSAAEGETILTELLLAGRVKCWRPLGSKKAMRYGTTDHPTHEASG